jgi:hypothetical protein
MNVNPTKTRLICRCWKVWAVVALAMANGFAAPAQETNHVGQADFSAFRGISEKNIFNLNRTARRRGRNRAQQGGDAFYLVGTMSYEKGTFAFFDGTGSEYRKILQKAGAIAGYNVLEITPTSVKLGMGGKQVTMKVGTQMRHEDQGNWQLVANSELPANPAEDVAPADGDTTSSSSSDEPNDVLKRLMQRREQELK